MLAGLDRITPLDVWKAFGHEPETYGIEAAEAACRALAETGFLPDLDGVWVRA